MKRYKRLTIRLTAFNVLMSGGILIAVLLVALSFVQEQIARANESAFRSTAESIVSYIDAEPIIQQSHLAALEYDNNVAIYIEDNRHPLAWRGLKQFGGEREALMEIVLDGARDLGLDHLSPPVRSGNAYFFVREGQVTHRCAVYIIVHGQSSQTIALLQDGAQERALFLRILGIFALTALASIVLFAFASYFFARRAVRPIQRAQTQQTEFVQAASHELRTPLAVISASASALSRADARQQARFRDTIEQETRYMGKLVDDMLTLAESDRDLLIPAQMPVDMRDLLEQTAREMQAVADGSNIVIRLSLPARLPIVLGDEHSFIQLLRILLDNAIEYSPEGAEIELRAQTTAHHITIEVADNGPGIPDEHKQDVFRRFFRMDKARAREKKHYGLGLSIAREIAERHKGQLSVQDNPNGGSVFVLRLRHI